MPELTAEEEAELLVEIAGLRDLVEMRARRLRKASMVEPDVRRCRKIWRPHQRLLDSGTSSGEAVAAGRLSTARLTLEVALKRPDVCGE